MKADIQTQIIAGLVFKFSVQRLPNKDELPCSSIEQHINNDLLLGITPKGSSHLPVAESVALKIQLYAMHGQVREK